MASVADEGRLDLSGLQIPLSKRLELGLLWAGMKKTLEDRMKECDAPLPIYPSELLSMDRVVADVVAARPSTERVRSFDSAVGEGLDLHVGPCDGRVGGGCVEEESAVYPGETPFRPEPCVAVDDVEAVSGLLPIPGEEMLRIGGRVAFGERVQTHTASSLGFCEQYGSGDGVLRDPERTFDYSDLGSHRALRPEQARKVFDYSAVCVRRVSDVTRAFRDVAEQGPLIYGQGEGQWKVLDLARSAVSFPEVARALQGTFVDLVVTLPDEWHRASGMSQTIWLEWASVAYALLASSQGYEKEGCLLRPAAKGEASLAFVVSALGSEQPWRELGNFRLMLKGVDSVMPRVAANYDGLCYLNFFHPKHRLAMAFEYGLCPRAEAIDFSFGLDVGHSVWLQDVGDKTVHVSPGEVKGGVKLKLQSGFLVPLLQDKRYGLRRLLRQSEGGAIDLARLLTGVGPEVRCGARGQRDLSEVFLARGLDASAPAEVAAVYSSLVGVLRSLAELGWHAFVETTLMNQVLRVYDVPFCYDSGKVVIAFRHMEDAVVAMGMLAASTPGDYIASSEPVCLRRLGPNLSGRGVECDQEAAGTGFLGEENDHFDFGGVMD